MGLMTTNCTSCDVSNPFNAENYQEFEESAAD